MDHKHPHSYPWHDYGKLTESSDKHAHGYDNPQVATKGKSNLYHDIASHYGTIKPGKKPNLKHYDLDKVHVSKVDAQIKKHGFQHYYAGGKHGKPDLGKRHYRTGHLMVYDPTSGSGGDFKHTDYTDKWRKTHELAHGLTLKHVNSKYGEGRRLGSLGVRSPREAKRAVEWEWHAAHVQRKLHAAQGLHISDKHFHKELNCLDSETEALTQRGWIKGFDLLSTDTLLTKNPVSGYLEWQQLTDLKLFPDHEGEVVEFRTATFNAISTPDHRWLVTNNSGNVVERTSSTIVNRGDRIHRTGDYNPDVNSVLSEDEAELLGWFVTDGCYKINPICNGRYKGRKGCTYIKAGVYAQLSQSRRANPLKCERIEKLLSRLDTKKEVRVPNKNLRTEQQVWTLGPSLTALLLSVAPNRCLETAILLQLNSAALLRLRESMILGDGNISKSSGQVTLVTGRKEQADAFQLLLTLTGAASSLVWRDLSGYSPKSEKLINTPVSKGCWVVTVLKRGYAQLHERNVSRYVTKVGVWCPVVPNTFFVARREGKVWVTGNTVMHDAVHRAVTGKFSEPGDEGFHPSSKKVPLHHALKMIDHHAKLKGLHHDDATAKKSESVTFAVVYNFSEDTRATPQTVATRRSRLAKVLHSYLNARRSHRQSLGQSYKAANDVNGGREEKIRNNLNRLTTLVHRAHGFEKKMRKRIGSWAHISMYQGLKTNGKRTAINRSALDTKARPANPKTYGRGKKIVGPQGHYAREKP